jgi:hypothetical protein
MGEQNERPGGWIEGIGWVALHSTLRPGDEDIAVWPAEPGVLGTAFDELVQVTRWADGTVPAPPAPLPEQPQPDGERVGWMVLIADGLGGWDADWDGLVHTDRPDADHALEAASVEWGAVLVELRRVTDRSDAAAALPVRERGTDVTALPEYEALVEFALGPVTDEGHDNEGWAFYGGAFVAAARAATAAAAPGVGEPT